MTGSGLPDFASVDPTRFAQLIKSTPDAKLAEVMRGELRDPILREVFARMAAVFQPDRAGNVNTVIHWVIPGRPDGEVDIFEVAIADGKCSVSRTPQQEPRLTLTLGPVDFLKVISNNANPVMMFMTGRLKATGDLGLAANIANFFTLPQA